MNVHSYLRAQAVQTLAVLVLAAAVAAVMPTPSVCDGRLPTNASFLVNWFVVIWWVALFQLWVGLASAVIGWARGF